MDVDAGDQIAAACLIKIKRARRCKREDVGDLAVIESDTCRSIVHLAGIAEERANTLDHAHIEVARGEPPDGLLAQRGGALARCIVVIGLAALRCRAGPHRSPKAVEQQPAEHIAVPQVVRRATIDPTLGEPGFDPVPQAARDDRVMLAWVVPIEVAHLTDVNPVGEEVAEAATGKWDATA